jgi:hypothetical protein
MKLTCHTVASSLRDPMLTQRLMDVFIPPAVQTEGESAPLKFSQVFHLMPVSNSFVVTNGKVSRKCHSQQDGTSAISCRSTCCERHVSSIFFVGYQGGRTPSGWPHTAVSSIAITRW